MAYVTVGRWGKTLAVRFPGDVARELGLREGEQARHRYRDAADPLRWRRDWREIARLVRAKLAAFATI